MWGAIRNEALQEEGLLPRGGKFNLRRLVSFFRDRLTVSLIIGAGLYLGILMAPFPRNATFSQEGKNPVCVYIGVLQEEMMCPGRLQSSDYFIDIALLRHGFELDDVFFSKMSVKQYAENNAIKKDIDEWIYGPQSTKCFTANERKDHTLCACELWP